MSALVESTATVERPTATQDRRDGRTGQPDGAALQGASKRAGVDTAIIDTDIHVYFSTQEVLRSYLGERWEEHDRTFGQRSYEGSHYPRAMPNAARHDAWPEDGTPPGSNLPLLQEQLLDEWGIEIGVLNPLVGAGQQRNLAFGAAFARATNEWQLAEWLEPEPRLRASIIVPWEDGELSAAEIDRWGSHPGFVHALLIARTKEPLGRRKYWPMYEAACRHDVPIAIHFGGAGGGPITGSGYPGHYIEDHGGMPQTFQAQVISLIFEGVFQQFPTLNVVLIEGGFAWIPPCCGGWTTPGAIWAAKCPMSPNRPRNLPTALLGQHTAHGGAVPAGAVPPVAGPPRSGRSSALRDRLSPLGFRFAGSRLSDSAGQRAPSKIHGGKRPPPLQVVDSDKFWRTNLYWKRQYKI